MLSLYVSIGSISVGGLHYRLCYSIKFIITLNEGLGLQLSAQNFSIFHRFCVCIVKNLNCGAPGPGPLVISLGPRAPWLLVMGPGGPWLSIKGPRASCLSVRSPVCYLGAPGLPGCRLGVPGSSGRQLGAPGC